MDMACLGGIFFFLVDWHGKTQPTACSTVFWVWVLGCVRVSKQAYMIFFLSALDWMCSDWLRHTAATMTSPEIVNYNLDSWGKISPFPQKLFFIGTFYYNSRNGARTVIMLLGSQADISKIRGHWGSFLRINNLGKQRTGIAVSYLWSWCDALERQKNHSENRVSGTLNFRRSLCKSSNKVQGCHSKGT